MAVSDPIAVPGTTRRANDIEKDAVHTDQGFMSDTKPDLTQPQLNVGGHANVQRQLRSFHITMIGFCSGIGTGLFIGAGQVDQLPTAQPCTIRARASSLLDGTL